MSLWTLSPTDGSLAPFSGTPTTRRWREAHLEQVLSLNPHLLHVDQELPLCLAGGTTSTSPDMSFVDELGRVTVVEIKNEIATPSALMQVLSYGEIWRGLPLGEASVGVRSLTSEGVAAQLLGRALMDLQAWLEATPGQGDPTTWTRRGQKVLARPGFAWANKAYRTVDDHGTAHSAEAWRSWPAPPTRAVLVAPGFSPECLALVHELLRRQVGLELHEADLQMTNEASPRVVLRWQESLGNHGHRRLWKAAKSLWKSEWLREHFGPNGWADHLSLPSFSFSSRQAPTVKIWLDTKDDKAVLSTAVPDRWLEGSARARLRRALLAALPPPDEKDRWLCWSYPLDEPGHSLAYHGEALGRVLHEQLVPLDGEWG